MQCTGQVDHDCLGTIQRRLALPLRKDDTKSSRSVNNLPRAGTHLLCALLNRGRPGGPILSETPAGRLHGTAQKKRVCNYDPHRNNRTPSATHITPFVSGTLVLMIAHCTCCRLLQAIAFPLACLSQFATQVCAIYVFIHILYFLLVCSSYIRLNKIYRS